MCVRAWQRLPCRRRSCAAHCLRAELDSEDPKLRDFVVDRPALKWSPQQISRALRAEYPDDPGMWLSTESIYLAVYDYGQLVAALDEAVETNMAGQRMTRGDDDRVDPMT